MAQSLNRFCCPVKSAQAHDLRTAVQIRNSHLNPRPQSISLTLVQPSCCEPYQAQNLRRRQP